MAKINECIAAGDTAGAANELFNALHYLFNSVPGIQITREEFKQIVPELVAKMEDPEAEASEEKEGPGNDIDVVAARAALKVTFEGPEDLTVPDPVERMFNVGGEYTYAPPSFVGYTADQTLLTGDMVAEGVEVTVTYTKDAEDEDAGTDAGAEDSNESEEPAEDGTETTEPDTTA